MSDRLNRVWRDILGNDARRSGPWHHGALARLGLRRSGYAGLRASLPDLDARLRGLARHPDIEALFDDGVAGAAELLHDLIALGDPVDRRVSDFSATHYVATYPEVARAGVGPLEHYLRFGMAENRTILRALREMRFDGTLARDPAKADCLLVLPDLAESGRSRIALRLLRQARASHNVTCVAMRPGAFLDRVRDLCCTVAIVPDPERDLAFLPAESLAAPAFALLCSVEASRFLRPLVDRDIPLAVYAPDYTDDTRPLYKALFSALFADVLAFPSRHVRASWDGLLADLGFDTGRDGLILPPDGMRPGGATAADIAQARARLSAAIGVQIGQRRLVVGGGAAHWRAGTDLFAMAATLAHGREPDTLFLWVGDGFNHDDPDFGLWMDRHLREIGADRPGGPLHILPDGPARRDATRAADAVFLSARLDPLTELAFDAVADGCRVVAFDGASALGQEPVGLVETVPYCDVPAAVDRLLAIPRKEAVSDAPPARDMPDIFAPIVAAMASRPVAPPEGADDFDVPVLFPNGPDHAASRARERRKFRAYGRRMIWPSAEAARAEIARSDNWVHRKLSVEPFAFRPEGTAPPDFAIHLHAHYLDGLEGELRAYRAYRDARRLVVTTDTRDKADAIRRHLDAADLSAEVLVRPNRGRDILPFLHLFQPDAEGRIVAAEGGVWAHVHHKKAPGTSSAGDIWRQFLMTILLGDATRLSGAVDTIAAAETGLVGAFDPYTSGWVGARRLLDRVHGLPGPLPERPLLFPIGNMFWTKAEVVAEMTRLFPPETPWPNEPIANDGTLFHLVERLWPSASAATGRRAVFLEKRDQPRA